MFKILMLLNSSGKAEANHNGNGKEIRFVKKG